MPTSSMLDSDLIAEGDDGCVHDAAALALSPSAFTIRSHARHGIDIYGLCAACR